MFSRLKLLASPPPTPTATLETRLAHSGRALERAEMGVGLLADNPPHRIVADLLHPKGLVVKGCGDPTCPSARLLARRGRLNLQTAVQLRPFLDWLCVFDCAQCRARYSQAVLAHPKAARRGERLLSFIVDPNIPAATYAILYVMLLSGFDASLRKFLASSGAGQRLNAAQRYLEPGIDWYRPLCEQALVFLHGDVLGDGLDMMVAAVRTCGVGYRRPFLHRHTVAAESIRPKASGVSGPGVSRSRGLFRRRRLDKDVPLLATRHVGSTLEEDSASLLNSTDDISEYGKDPRLHIDLREKAPTLETSKKSRFSRYLPGVFSRTRRHAHTPTNEELVSLSFGVPNSSRSSLFDGCTVPWELGFASHWVDSEAQSPPPFMEDSIHKLYFDSVADGETYLPSEDGSDQLTVVEPVFTLQKVAAPGGEACFPNSTILPSSPGAHTEASLTNSLIISTRHEHGTARGTDNCEALSRFKSICLHPLNVLLIFVPTALVCGHTILNTYPQLVLAFSLIAIIPLVKIMQVCTEEDEQSSKENRPCYLVTFPCTAANVPELVNAILAVRSCDLRMIQSSLIGTTLVHAVLIPGIYMLVSAFGSPRTQSHRSQDVQHPSNMATTFMLFFTCLASVLPLTTQLNNTVLNEPRSPNLFNVLSMERVAAVTILIVYLFLNASVAFNRRRGMARNGSSSTALDHLDVAAKLRVVGESNLPRKQLGVTYGILLATLVALVFTLDGLDQALLLLTNRSSMGTQLVTFILLPLAENAAELILCVSDGIHHFGRQRKSTQSRLEESMLSITQIYSFIIPFTVCLAWILGRPVSLQHDFFETAVSFFSILLLSHIPPNTSSPLTYAVPLIGIYVLSAYISLKYSGTNLLGLSQTCT